jgi:hypothetical protein
MSIFRLLLILLLCFSGSLVAQQPSKPLRILTPEAAAQNVKEEKVDEVSTDQVVEKDPHGKVIHYHHRKPKPFLVRAWRTITKPFRHDR